MRVMPNKSLEGAATGSGLSTICQLSGHVTLSVGEFNDYSASTRRHNKADGVFAIGYFTEAYLQNRGDQLPW